jgi:hypothetical protein
MVHRVPSLRPEIIEGKAREAPRDAGKFTSERGVMIPVFRARFKDKVLQVDARFYSWVSTLGEEFEILARKIRKPASPRQRKYYHGVIVKMFAEFMSGIDTKESHAEAHDALRVKFLSQTDDHGLTVIRSTESLSTVEKEEYHAECRRLGDSLGFYIPLPNECEY